jgi:hypothetical protein
LLLEAREEADSEESAVVVLEAEGLEDLEVEEGAEALGEIEEANSGVALVEDLIAELVVLCQKPRDLNLLKKEAVDTTQNTTGKKEAKEEMVTLAQEEVLEGEKAKEVEVRGDWVLGLEEDLIAGLKAMAEEDLKDMAQSITRKKAARKEKITFTPKGANLEEKTNLDIGLEEDLLMGLKAAGLKLVVGIELRVLKVLEKEEAVMMVKAQARLEVDGESQEISLHSGRTIGENKRLDFAQLDRYFAER